MISKLIGHLIKVILIKARKFQLDRWKKHGLVVGKNLSINPGVDIDTSHCWQITIGDDVSLGPKVHILAHDGSTRKHIGYTLIGKVHIGNKVLVGTNAVILPGVTIGDNSIVGAGSVILKDVPPNVVVAGNPARIICTIEEFTAKHRKRMQSSPVFGEEYTIAHNVTDIMKAEMVERLGNQFGYIV